MIPGLPVAELVFTLHHFFPALPRWLAARPDPRDQDQLIYPKQHLCWLGLLLFLGQYDSRRHLNDLAAEGEGLAANLRALGAPPNTNDRLAVAHGDTLQYYLERIDDQALTALYVQHVHALHRQKLFADGRLLDTYYPVAVDGTETISFHHRHCEACLTQQQSDGATRFFHPVLDARLVVGRGCTVHLASAAIANPAPNPSKQQCEATTFPVLAAQLQQDYPRWPLCLLGDALYATAPVLDRCAQAGWKYIFTLKEGTQPTLWAEVQRRRPRARTRVSTAFPPGSPVRRQVFWWLPDLSCQGHVVHVFGCDETVQEKGELVTHHHVWMSNLRPTRGNVEELSQRGGRGRWQIEATFNAQKHGGWELEHAFGERGDTWRHYYVLRQLAYLYWQLCHHTDAATVLARHSPWWPALAARAARTGRAVAGRVVRQGERLWAFAQRLRDACHRDRPGELLDHAAGLGLYTDQRVHFNTS